MGKRITILGAGIAGLTTAIALKNIGINAMIFEAANEIKEVGAGLGLGANAIKALKILGIENDVISKGRFLPSFTIYDQSGQKIITTDSVSLSKKYGLDNFSIHRADLHQVLLSKLDPACIQTNKQVDRIKQHEEYITIYFKDGTAYETDYLIAADGIHSVIRKQLLPGSKIRYAGYTCWRAVIDNTNLQVNECSETWAAQGRFGIVPLSNNRIYWFACVNTVADNPVMKKYKVDDLLQQFNNFHHPVKSILQETKNENMIWSDVIDLKPIDQFAFGNIILTGDAAHATTPNLGQGACQAIEDAVILANEIKKSSDIAMAFKSFEQLRLKRTRWITNTSWTIGKTAQLENKLLVKFRDMVLKKLPAKFHNRQFKKIYTTDF
jgi:2-polyprenyl-6-methoxyphenol hydroxylase-like FAD-dependent oxidoreductase